MKPFAEQCCNEKVIDNGRGISAEDFEKARIILFQFFIERQPEVTATILSPIQVQIWRFPEMGVPPVLIRFNRISHDFPT